MPIAKTEWKQMEGPGHFVAAAHCSFIRHTHIGNYCISTVGEYRPGGNPDLPIEMIGWQRTYETLVFPIDDEGQNLSWTELDFGGYNSAERAEAGHLEMCRKYAEKQESRR